MPSILASGNISPQSMISKALSYSNAIIFMPISPNPRGDQSHVARRRFVLAAILHDWEIQDGEPRQSTVEPGQTTDHDPPI